MSYVFILIQIISAIPDLIRAYREIKKIADEEKEGAKLAMREITTEFKQTGDAKRFKENLLSFRSELSNLPRV
jgi:hypothetical protein